MEGSSISKSTWDMLYIIVWIMFYSSMLVKKKSIYTKYSLKEKVNLSKIQKN